MENRCNELTSDPMSSEADYFVLSNISDYQRKIFQNRYWYAVDQIKRAILRNLESPIDILDAATGSGPGAAYIAEQIKAHAYTFSVVGVDTNVDAIQYAIEHYSGVVDYWVRDIVNAATMQKWAVVVSMETLEYITPEKAHKFLNAVYMQLAPGGLFICSTPRRRPRESKVKRPGHINEM
ncbi:unnamed protein product, partial [marine sediment metagenome]